MCSSGQNRSLEVYLLKIVRSVSNIVARRTAEPLVSRVWRVGEKRKMGRGDGELVVMNWGESWWYPSHAMDVQST